MPDPERPARVDHEEEQARMEDAIEFVLDKIGDVGDDA